MSHLGDYDLSTVVYGKFTSYRPSTGASYTLGGTPALSVYKDNSTTQSTSGVSLTADFDSVTGLNHFAIDTSTDGSFYSAGSFFDIVITTGTVDSVSVTGTVVASFTIRKNSSLKPTTAGRTLDVSTGGEAGIDLANVGSPTTTLALTGTTIATSQVVASVSGAVASVTGTVGGIAGTTQTLDALQTALNSAHGSGSWATATGFAVPGDQMDLVNAPNATAVAAIQSGLATATALATAQTDLDLITGADGAVLATLQPNVTFAEPGDEMALTAGASASLTAEIWAYVIAGTTTAVQAMRGFCAALLGKASGLSANQPKYRDIADTKNVITAQTDQYGNRNSVTLDLD